MKTIAIVAGGNSSECVISVKSAALIAGELDKSEYLCYVVQVRGQQWEVLLPDNEKTDIDKNDFSFKHKGKKINFDCALIAIHGTPGEDGKLQSYFELVGLPYTTCGVFSSALTFNKYACKLFLKEYGVKSAKAVLLKKNTHYSPKAIVKQLGMPVFVKPNESGSSFGVSKVKSVEILIDSINHAFSESDEVIIEKCISGTEITCGLFKTKEKEIIFPVTEVVSKKEFFDFEAKYTSGMSEEITPARISKNIEQICRQTSSKIYDLLNCRGIVRIDYIISGNDLYFLEVNTVPGMSPSSIVPKQIKTMGLNISDVYKLIIDEVSGSKVELHKPILQS